MPIAPSANVSIRRDKSLQPLLGVSLGAEPTETFRLSSRGAVERVVRRRNGTLAVSQLGVAPKATAGSITAEAAERIYLRTRRRPVHAVGQPLKCVDLFSGCGGFSLGAEEAARALGRSFEPIAVDFDAMATEVYGANFGSNSAACADVRTLIDRGPGKKLSVAEKAFCHRASHVELLIGGPPCQGHSALNYRTRHRDDRNALYEVMVRAAEILEPSHVLIENVPGALKDRQGVVQRSMEGLERLGYRVSSTIVVASKVGVPQARRRLLVIATRTKGVDASTLMAAYQVPERSVRWAIEDLADLREGLLDEPAASAKDTVRRINYLFDNDLYELPNTQRPKCHQGDHSYVSIYGRMPWDSPAQTVTTGFYSMCMGRYVHPSRRRTITAHEAARLQFFPDFFDFSAARNRGDLSLMIGNAVPPKLSYIATLELLR
jgi:DNA (cytosine-5)-methyltransferase 1